MKKNPTAPAVQKAFSYIKSRIHDGVWRTGEYLPSTVKLAGSIKVSPVSVTRAVALLRAEGLVSGVRRGRLRIGGEAAESVPELKSENPVWRMKRTALEKDILSGVFAQQGNLPSQKELHARYGTSFQTMRKVLRSLVGDGVVSLQGKRFALPAIDNRLSNQRVVFITYHIQTIPQSALNQGHHRVLSLLENECIQRGLRLEIVEIDFYNPVETRKKSSDPVINAPALGYILDLWWYPGDLFRQSQIDLLARLALLKRPISILDELGDFELPSQFAASPLYQLFQIEGKRAGERVARLLLRLGHRSVVYLSSQHFNAYSRLRLEGVKAQFTHAGLPDGVVPMVTDKIGDHMTYLLAISGFSEKLIRKVLASDRTESQVKDGFDHLKHYLKAKPAEVLKPEEVATIRKNFSCIIDLADRNLDPHYFNQICLAAITESSTQLSAISLNPLFVSALEHKDATAWICANDGIAAAALLFLREHAIRVPVDISVVGFDNSPANAIEQRLTTFDFNAAGFIHRMLNFIVRPPKPRGPYRHVAIEVEGIIMERETTGKVRAGLLSESPKDL